MPYKYIVDNTATLVETGLVRHAIITINKTLSGTINVIDGIADGSANVATITNPTVGQSYHYYNLRTGLVITASGSCDITAQTDNTLVS